MDAGDSAGSAPAAPVLRRPTLGSSAPHAGPLLSARRRAMQMPVRMTFECFAPR
jgi:hypothetical protein